MERIVNRISRVINKAQRMRLVMHSVVVRSSRSASSDVRLVVLVVDDDDDEVPESCKFKLSSRYRLLGFSDADDAFVQPDMMTRQKIIKATLFIVLLSCIITNNKQ